MTSSSARSLDDKGAHAYAGDQSTWRVNIKGEGGMYVHRLAECASSRCIVKLGAGELGDATGASEQRPSKPGEPPDEPYEEKQDAADVQVDQAVNVLSN